LWHHIFSDCKPLVLSLPQRPGLGA
jgi:hypothetical protein